MKYDIIDANRTRESYNWLQSYSLESLEKEFNRQGLSIQTQFSDVTGTAFKEGATEMAVVVKKR